MKKSLEVKNSFETQTEQELREIIGGSSSLTGTLGDGPIAVPCYGIFWPYGSEE